MPGLLSLALAPTFSLRINGAPLPPAATADLIAASVDQDVGAPAMFSVRLRNWHPARHAVTWSDDMLFAVGNQVEIAMGYQGELETLISGEITGLEPEFRAGEAPTLTVRGYDRGHRLMRGRKTRSFTATKDSAIAERIAVEAGLRAEVDDTGVTFAAVLQHNQTDLEFLTARAERIGYEVRVSGETLLFRRRRHDERLALTISHGAELLEFYPRLSAVGQVGRVTVRGWDPGEKAAVVGRAGIGDEAGTMDGVISGPQAAERAFGKGAEPAAGIIVDLPVASRAEADQVAQGHYRAAALAYIGGEGVCRGRTDLRAGEVIRIEGLGTRFSGRYYVVAASHSYSPGQGYRTSFSVRRNAT